ncbi:MAG: c-type cytochrome [Sphingobacteriaceae bacterium]|nr:c-type cytochrome [Sphingobacteriaceae bacterium]
MPVAEEDVPLTPYPVTWPYYFPNLEIPDENQMTLEGINLGRHLYYDTILSRDGRACADCHSSASAFTTYTSNALPHINLGWNSNFLWNGKVQGKMEDIMLFEVKEFFNTDLDKINQSAFYKKEFKKVYKADNVTAELLSYALSQFFRAMVSKNSLCDKFILHTANLNDSEMRGFNIFTTEKGDCFHCHSLGLFTDNKFHNIGLDSIFLGQNMGRYNYTGLNKDLGLFKTPTLRNIELTAPYMHDGRYTTLEEVVEHYNSKVKHSNTLDPIMTKPSKLYGLGLTPQEKQDLVAFLKTLTDNDFINNPLLQKP